MLCLNWVYYCEVIYKEHQHYRLIKTGKYYAKVIKTKQRSLACFRQIESDNREAQALWLKVRVENVA